MEKFLRLHQELHARPLPDIRVGSTVFHLAMFRGEGSVAKEREHLDLLARTVSASTQTAGESHLLLTIGGSSLKVEFHTEFTEYTFIKNSLSDFNIEPTTGTIPTDWIESIPGEIVNRLHICVEAVGEYATEDQGRDVFGTDSIVASNVSENQFRVWSDFRVSGRGNTRILIQSKSEDADRIGRAVQRIIDIEDYRLVAFIGLQKAREIAVPMSDVESKLETMMQHFKEIDSIVGEKTMLADLIDLSADVELLKTRCMNRFRATEAYAEIMSDRLKELRETKIDGCISISEFLLRRSTPAFRTCRASKDRILDLSLRVSRAAELLRTRIDVQIEEQNQQLLRSVDRRASLQNRLQLTIEWFSVIAVSVYVLQLLKIFLDAGKEYIGSLNVPLLLGATAPVVFVAVGIVVNRIRRRYKE